MTVKLRWELDAEAEAQRVAAAKAAENEKLRQARAKMLQKVASPFCPVLCVLTPDRRFPLRADRRAPCHAHV